MRYVLTAAAGWAVAPENGSLDALFGGAGQIGLVALKAVLLYLTAVLGFRFARRRTLAQLTAVDFVAGAAVGAIVGRVPNSDNTSYLFGAVTLVAVLVAHNIVVRLRNWPTMSQILDHSPRVLVQDGVLLENQLRRAGISRPELFALLRQQGVVRLAEVRYAILEPGGTLSLVRADDPALDGPAEVLDDALDGQAHSPQHR
jgi:uncharacterized membrane protein YcaP (DUF421 family)